MFRKFLIKKDERGLLFRKGDFVTVLHAGEHRFDPIRYATDCRKVSAREDRVRPSSGRLPASRRAGAD